MFVWIALFPLAAGVSPAGGQGPGFRQARTLEETFIRIAESVTPGVVFIRTVGTRKAFAARGRKKEGPAPPRGGLIPRRSFGSGFIFDAEGHILTNHHVLEGVKRITVVLSDGSEHPAELVGTDKRTDLAVIRILTEDRPASVRLGDSDRLRTGQWAIAIGHPYGLRRTVTVGVVSGIGRTGMGIAHYENFIQTDASIHPGNSGGPLVNLKGEVIGVNTAIIPRSNGGIAFSIPINMAKWVARSLIQKGVVERGLLGLMIQPFSSDLAAKFGLDRPVGALVSDLMRDGAAMKAGIKRGDVVLEFNGRPVRDVPELQRFAAASPPGAVVKLGIQRNGRRLRVPLVMGTLQPPRAAPRPEPAPEKSSYGLKVGALTQGMTRVLGMRGVRGGVQVMAVRANSRASFDGFQVGDVIKAVEGRPVRDEAAFREALRKAPEKVLALIYRTGRSLFRVLHDPHDRR
ncbi:MAG: trypsin-like peptidase domain-containing protein [Nitrospinota bacterium]|nr:trypsin-like peptidase domain-containing protein [Nitrospinota bacterium]